MGFRGAVLGDVKGDTSRERDSAISETSSIDRCNLKSLDWTLSGDYSSSESTM